MSEPVCGELGSVAVAEDPCETDEWQRLLGLADTVAMEAGGPPLSTGHLELAWRGRQLAEFGDADEDDFDIDDDDDDDLDDFEEDEDAEDADEEDEEEEEEEDEEEEDDDEEFDEEFDEFEDDDDEDDDDMELSA